jgi:8-oxo-dGTP diphosphatase
MDENQRRILRGTLMIIRRADGKYLLFHETKGVHKGMWIFSGGSYDTIKTEDRSETGIECVVRETQEETGITPINPRFKAKIFFDNHLRIFPGETKIANFDYEGAYYLSTDYSGEAKPISPEGKEQGWFSYEETKNLPMHEGDRRFLEILEKSPLEKVIDGVIVHEGSRLKTDHFEFLN